MYLDTTSKSLQVILAGAVTTNQLPWVSAFGEVAADNTTSAPKASNGLTNSGTAVTVVAAPGSSLVRELLHFSVQNADTVAATVTVRLNDGGTFRPIVKVTLQTGENLLYDTGGGWRVLDVNGNVKAGTQGPTGATGATGAAGTLAIGTAIGSGSASRVLYADGSVNLADSANLGFDGNTLAVVSSTTADAITATAGVYVAKLANSGSTYAGSFTDGSHVVVLADGTYAVNVTSGHINALGTNNNTYRWNSAIASPSISLSTVAAQPLYGANTAVLGEPDAWVLVNVNGTDYKVPCYL